MVKEGCVAKGVGFHTTQWSVIVSAADRANPRSEEALAQLCTHYWYPIYAFARHTGYGPHDSQRAVAQLKRIWEHHQIAFRSKWMAFSGARTQEEGLAVL